MKLSWMFLLLLIAGCASPKAVQAPIADPEPRIDKLQLQANPSVMNLDAIPGADGIQARLYLFRIDQPLAVPLRAGRIEIVMYDGRVADGRLNAAEPRKIWAFNADELSQFASDSAFGTAYGMVLRWGDDAPSERTLTLTARLLRPDASPRYAVPIYLAAGVR